MWRIEIYEHGPPPNNAIGIDYWWANKDKQAQVMQYLENNKNKTMLKIHPNPSFHDNYLGDYQ